MTDDSIIKLLEAEIQKHQQTIIALQKGLEALEGGNKKMADQIPKTERKKIRRQRRKKVKLKVVIEPAAIKVPAGKKQVATQVVKKEIKLIIKKNAPVKMIKKKEAATPKSDSNMTEVKKKITKPGIAKELTMESEPVAETLVAVKAATIQPETIRYVPETITMETIEETLPETAVVNIDSRQGETMDEWLLKQFDDNIPKTNRELMEIYNSSNTHQMSDGGFAANIAMARTRGVLLNMRNNNDGLRYNGKPEWFENGNLKKEFFDNIAVKK